MGIINFYKDFSSPTLGVGVLVLGFHYQNGETINVKF
jgi:hypothetical protein